MKRKKIDSQEALLRRIDSFMKVMPEPKELARYLKYLKLQGAFNELEESDQRFIRSLYLGLAAIGHRHVMTFGGIKPLVKLGPAPPWLTKYLKSQGVLDGLDERGRRALTVFYCHVVAQLQLSKRFDDACASSSPTWVPHPPPTPAMREKLKSISRKISKVLEMANFAGVGDKDLLSDAQAKVKQFQEQRPLIKAGLYTGERYLRSCGEDWLAHRPAVAFAFFVLLHEHGRPRLTKPLAYERVGRLHKDVFGISVGTDAIRQMVSRFGSDEAEAWRIRKFLMKIEKLPPFNRTK